MEDIIQTTTTDNPQSNKDTNKYNHLSSNRQKPKRRWYKSWSGYECLLVQLYNLLIEWFKLQFFIEYHTYPPRFLSCHGILKRSQSLRKSTIAWRKSRARNLAKHQYNTLCDRINSCHTELATARRVLLAIPLSLTFGCFELFIF